MRIGYPVQICKELIPTIQFISENNKDTEIPDLVSLIPKNLLCTLLT